MDVGWEIILVQEVHDWLIDLSHADPESANLVSAAIDQLAARGPNLGRPLADTVKGSRLKHLKELRPGSTARSELRLLFAFDPKRQAVILVAGDKAGEWRQWYQDNIPLAERRFEKWLAGGYDEEL